MRNPIPKSVRDDLQVHRTPLNDISVERVENDRTRERSTRRRPILMMSAECAAALGTELLRHAGDAMKRRGLS